MVPFGLVLAAFGTPAQADERILRYLSDVQVQRDSSLEVTETIDVRAEHDRINHGIYRDFPIRYRGAHGGQMRVGFAFEGATLDGRPVPASTETIANGVRIKLGDPDTSVDVGEHSYVLHYRTTRQVGRFKGYDELYWNATGNGWIFPIDVAETRIRLPAPARFGQRAAYTGPQGSTASNAEVVEETPGDILFRTTLPLAPYEGLTVAVAFPKGVVGEPAASSRLAQWLGDYGPPLAGLLGLLGLAGFYYVAWRRAGRNPRAGTVVPIFTPPDELSPPAMRFVTQMGTDNRTFAAALVDMGVRGHIRMTEEDGGWFKSDKTRLERLASTTPLPAEEQAALGALVATGDSILMEQENHDKFSAAKSAMEEVLKKNFEGRLFKRNLGWALAGAMLFAAAIWLVAAAVVAATGASSLLPVGVSLGAFAVAALLLTALHDSSSTGKCLLSMGATAAGAAAAVTAVPVVGQALATGWLLPFLPVVIALPLVISAFWWIAAPTREGRTVLDHIAGFRQYLSIAEG